MKNLLIATMFCCIAMLTTAAENYIININGETHDIGLNSAKEIQLSNGEKIEVELMQKKTVQYESPHFNFSHSSKLIVKSHESESGGLRTTLVSHNGTVITIEVSDHYSDPSSALDYASQAMSKIGAEKGSDYQEKNVSRVVGKINFEGKQLITMGKGTKMISEIYAADANCSTILVMTMIETINNSKEQFIIEDFWKSLELK